MKMNVATSHCLEYRFRVFNLASEIDGSTAFHLIAICRLRYLVLTKSTYYFGAPTKATYRLNKSNERVSDLTILLAQIKDPLTEAVLAAIAGYVYARCKSFPWLRICFNIASSEFL